MTDRSPPNPSNPPAFPYQQNPAWGGMTLRDYFAAAAIQGLYAGYYANPEMAGLAPESMASDAYQIADAMLTERERR